MPITCPTLIAKITGKAPGMMIDEHMTASPMSAIQQATRTRLATERFRNASIRAPAQRLQEAHSACPPTGWLAALSAGTAPSPFGPFVNGCAKP